MPPRPSGILADLDALSVLEKGSGTGGDVLTEMVERWAIDVKNGHAQRRSTRALVRTQAERLGLPADSFLFAFDSAAAEDPKTNGNGKTSRQSPAAKRPPRERTPEELATILVPGTHKDDEDAVFEIGNDDFVKAVLDALPEGTIYRMDREVGSLVGEPGDLRFVPLDDTATRILVDANLRLGGWVKIKATEATPEHQALSFATCTRDLGGLVRAAAGADDRVRELQMIVRHPVYLPGLSLAKPGWNESGGVFYDEPDALKGVKPDPEHAIEVLDDLTVDFPFKDDASRENFYSMMLTLVARPAIDGNIPFSVVAASLERTGKGKLIDVGSLAVRGSRLTPIQLGRTEEETEKRITSQIIHGATLVHFDNVPVGEALDSPSLASLATGWPRWGGRKLGSSTIIDLPNRMVVALSANNPKATGELVKRSVPIILSPHTDHPELREDFQHQDCYGYALAQRPKVLAALLGIVEGWKAAGRPPHTVRLGGFERWVEIVVGSLAHAGAKSIMGNYRDWVRAANDEGADIETLVEAWWNKHRDTPIEAKTILELVKATETFPEVLKAPTDGGQRVSLGRRVLTPLVDRPVNGKIVRKGGNASNSRYWLESGGLFDEKPAPF